MTRRQATESTAQERVDAAVVDAYERRIAGQAATAEDAALEAEIAAAELSAYTALHARVAGLAQAEVAPSVRAVVLSAAVQAAEENAERAAPQSSLARLFSWLLRPAPVLGMVTAIAVLVGISVRHETAQTAPPAGETAVASSEAASPPEAVVVPSAPAPEHAPAAAAEPPLPAAAAPAPALAASPASAAPPPPESAPGGQLARPVRTFEAQAASLGPVDAPAVPKAEALSAQRESPVADEKRPMAKPTAAANEYEAVLDQAPSGRAEQGNKRAMAKEIADSLKQETQVGRAAAGAAQNAPQQAQVNAAPASNAQADESKGVRPDQNVATRNQVAEKANTDAVARSRQAVEDAQGPEERIAALKQLVVAAQAAGDEKTVKGARLALKAAEAQWVAQKRSESLQETPPAKRAKAAPSQGTEELKAQKKN